MLICVVGDVGADRGEHISLVHHRDRRHRHRLTFCVTSDVSVKMFLFALFSPELYVTKLNILIKQCAVYQTVCGVFLQRSKVDQRVWCDPGPQNFTSVPDHSWSDEQRKQVED